ncbi:MAG: SDR family oxidoreductase [Ardenticatenaceae bacterium]|nr:SDR family oxidoreductase [Ardenticatenaceae bacterium]MCB9004647.1 SDR family oxidoreductase [Ardenticatenaceae bacterium]
MKIMTKYILITGISTGIGYAAAEMLVQRGYHVFGSVRKQADAGRVQAALGDGVTPLLFDVTDHEGVATAVTQIRATLNGQNLAGLVNNAGVSLTGPLMHLPVDELRRQFEVNLFGLLDVTQQCLPLLGARLDAPGAHGRIVNISSVSGKIAYPFMGAYAASKHALEALSDSLRRELLLYGIDVILIEPGTTATPIIGKASDGMEQYAQTDYDAILQKVVGDAVTKRQRTAIPVEKVAAKIVEALESQHPKTRYAIPRKWFTGWFLPRILPDRWFDRMAAQEMGLH